MGVCGCGGGHEFAGAIGFDLELAIWRLAADAGSEAGIWQLMGARGGCGVCSSLTFDYLSEALVLGGSRCLAILVALRSLVLGGSRCLAIPGALRLPIPYLAAKEAGKLTRLPPRLRCAKFAGRQWHVAPEVREK